MPISRDAFEKGEVDPALLILQFLKSNEDTAYSLKELLSESASHGLNLSEGDLINIMSSLQDRKRVESKMKRGVLYYIYRKPKLGFR